MDRPASDSVVCPACSAENSRGPERCFVCGQLLAGATDFPQPKPSTEPAAGRRPTFRIISLMLVIALIAVFLGVYHEAPGIALLLAVPTTIALIRTVAVAEVWPGPRSWFDHAAIFVATFAVVVIVAVAAGASFFVTCLAVVYTGELNSGIPIDHPYAYGTVVGVAVMVGLTVALVLWSRRRRLHK